MNGLKTENEQQYLLTGATGFLGSHIMAGLLSKRKRLVVVGRHAGSESLHERIRKRLNWFGLGHLEELIEFYETDFLKPGLGLEKANYDNLCSKGLSIIHCASDTRFGEKNREKVMASNVGNLIEILNFAQQSRAAAFHFISTAFAAGSDPVECPEALINPVHFNNVYEESKARAEKIVSERCREANIPYTIIRPSIVYGDSITGRSLKFNALYYPVRFLHYIRDIYLDDIKKKNGIKSAECGIFINDAGILHLPIRIFIPSAGKINLIPVNYFTETFFSIIQTPVTETVYHITTNKPESTATLIAYAARFLNITGLEIVIGASVADEMRNPPEELFDHFIKVYRPYISDKRVFIRQNTDRATCGDLPPDFSYEIFQRCMTFAVSVDWGRRLFA